MSERPTVIRRAPEGAPFPGPCEWMTAGADPEGREIIYLGCPQCEGLCNLVAHTITHHEDGTLTVAPSILHSWPYGETREERCGAHFYIRANRIEYC